MRIIKKEELQKSTPFEAPLGEKIYEMIGKPDHLGGTTNHSLATVLLPPGKCSPKHYHKISEEIYYILSGEASIIVNEEEFDISSGDTCLIMPGDEHQIFNDSDQEVKFLVTSAPARDPTDTYQEKI